MGWTKRQVKSVWFGQRVRFELRSRRERQTWRELPEQRDLPHQRHRQQRSGQVPQSMSAHHQQRVQPTMPCPQSCHLQGTTTARRLTRPLPLPSGLRQRLARRLHRFSGAVPAAAGPSRCGCRPPDWGQPRQLRTPGLRRRRRTPESDRRRSLPSQVLCQHLLKRQGPKHPLPRRRLLKHPMRSCSPGSTTPERRFPPAPSRHRAATARRPGCAAGRGAGKRSPTTEQARLTEQTGESVQGFQTLE